MSEGLPSLDGIQWTKGTSTNGSGYQVGAKDINSSTQMPPRVTSETHSVDPAIQVNWPVSGSNIRRWIEASQAVKDAGISRYALCKNSPNDFYHYTLWITNTREMYWRFFDETGDHYDIATPQVKQDWTIQFNSSKPTIISVGPETIHQ